MPGAAMRGAVGRLLADLFGLLQGLPEPRNSASWRRLSGFSPKRYCSGRCSLDLFMRAEALATVFCRSFPGAVLGLLPRKTGLALLAWIFSIRQTP